MILEKIYEGTCISQEASEEMLELLLGQQTVTKIPAGLPEGVEVATIFYVSCPQNGPSARRRWKQFRRFLRQYMSI